MRCSVKQVNEIAFDRVWHKGLLYKRKHNGIDDTLLQWLTSYLSNRKQRVAIPGACMEWVAITAGVPQGSILVDEPCVAATQLNSNLAKNHMWTERWLVKFNPAKSEAIVISRKTNKPYHPPLKMNDQPIKEVTSHKHLGFFLI